MLSHSPGVRSGSKRGCVTSEQLRRNFFRSFFSRRFLRRPRTFAGKRNSPLERRPFVDSVLEKNWSGRRGSNPRPRPWQGRALPLSYTRIRIGGDCAPATAELCQMQPPNATASAIPVWPAESAFNPETRVKTPLDRAKPRRSPRERLLTSSADCKSGLQAPIRAGKC
jgi:hypothetical protein